MYYVKDKEDNIFFKTTFFTTAHQYAQALADELGKVILLCENETVVKYFYAEDNEPFYL